MIWELTVELNNLFSLADRVLADTSVRAKVTLGILCVKYAHSLIKTKLHNFLDLFQLFDDQNQLELVSIELVLLDDKLVVGHDHLASAKSPVVDWFRPRLDHQNVHHHGFHHLSVTSAVHVSVVSVCLGAPTS